MGEEMVEMRGALVGVGNKGGDLEYVGLKVLGPFSKAIRCSWIWANEISWSND